MTDVNDWNRRIIDEFRGNAGRVGGRFEGRNLLLLHTTGARTGKTRVNPLAYQDLGGGDVAVFGSAGGAPRDPDWFHNVRANPQVRVELGSETYDAVARVAEGEERDRIWANQKAESSGWATYEERTSRPIPVVVISRTG